jgi:hypothetical protein
MAFSKHCFGSDGDAENVDEHGTVCLYYRLQEQVSIGMKRTGCLRPGVQHHLGIMLADGTKHLADVTSRQFKRWLRKQAAASNPVKVVI